MSPSILPIHAIAVDARTKTEIRTLSNDETKVVAAGTGAISPDDFSGGAQPDGNRNIRADRVYRK